MITIDGSTLEGGGQLTRLALCLSAITGTPVRIHSIRAGRSRYRRVNHADDDQRGDKYGKRGSKVSGKDSRSHRYHHHHHQYGSARHLEGNIGKSNSNSSSSTTTTTIPSSKAGGLKDSHLAALHFLAEHSNARVTGDFVGSTEVTFRPSMNLLQRTACPRGAGAEEEHAGRASGTRHFTIALSKSGSVWLIFQAVLPFLLFCTDWSAIPGGDDDGNGSNEEHPCIVLTLKGGTNVDKAMSTEYVQQVFLPILERIGCPRITVDVVSRGWAGHTAVVGEVKVKIYRPVVDKKESVSVSSGIHEPSPTCSLSPSNGRLILHPFRIPLLPVSLGETTVDIDAKGVKYQHSVREVAISIIAEPESTRKFLLETLTALLSQQSAPTATHSSFAFAAPRISNPVNEPSHNPHRLYILLVAHVSLTSSSSSFTTTTNTTSNADTHHLHNMTHPIGHDYLDPGIKHKSPVALTAHLTKVCESVVRGLSEEVKFAFGGDGNRNKSIIGVDQHCQDQLVVFQALAVGMSRVGFCDGDKGGEVVVETESKDEDGNEIDKTKVERVEDEHGTLHTRTVRWVCEQILEGVGFEKGGVCHGIGCNVDHHRDDGRIDDDVWDGMKVRECVMEGELEGLKIGGA